MRKTAFAGIVVLSNLFSASAAYAENKVLTPKIKGVEFTIDCERDFPDGEPSLDVLGRLDSHLHGFNDNLYTASNGGAIVQQRTAFLPAQQRAQVISTMDTLLKEYRKADAQNGARDWLLSQLDTQHSINDETFFSQVVQRCNE